MKVPFNIQMSLVRAVHVHIIKYLQGPFDLDRGKRYGDQDGSSPTDTCRGVNCMCIIAEKEGCIDDAADLDYDRDAQGDQELETGSAIVRINSV